MVGQLFKLRADFESALSDCAAHPERPVTNRPAGWNPAPPFRIPELDGILIDVQKLVQVNDDVAQVRQRLQPWQLCLGLSGHLTVQKRDVFVELFGGRLAAQSDAERDANLRLLFRTG